MGADHPIAWYHEYDGGRAWYTALGHTSASYYEPLFLGSFMGWNCVCGWGKTKSDGNVSSNRCPISCSIDKQYAIGKKDPEYSGLSAFVDVR